MANTIGWGKAHVNNSIDFGKAHITNTIGFGNIGSVSNYGQTTGVALTDDIASFLLRVTARGGVIEAEECLT